MRDNVFEIEEEEEEEEEEEDDEPLGEGEYVVEAIRDDRKYMDEIQYLIKWKGYPEEENTWVNKDNINADELIAEYRKKKKRERAARRKPRHSNINSSRNHRKGMAIPTAVPTAQQLLDRKIDYNGANSKNRQSSKESYLDDISDIDQRKKPKATEHQDELFGGSTARSNSSSAKGSPKKTWSPLDMTDWESSVVSVLSVERTEDRSLLICLKWKNGYCTIHNAEEVNKRCPQKVIKFYEKNLQFKPDT